MNSEIKDIQYKQIRKIKVKSLFGLFNYDIPLYDSGITILIGVNGSGKSTIFKILNSILNKEFYNILDVDFKLFEINFNNGNIIKCERNVQDVNVNETLLNLAGNKRLENYENFRQGVKKLWGQEKTLSDFTITVETEGSMVQHNFIKLRKNPTNKEITYIFNNITSELRIILDELGTKSRFIETQRLQLNSSDIDESVDRYSKKHIFYTKTLRAEQKYLDDFDISINKSRIVEYANDLSNVIKLKRSNYFAESQDVEKKTLSEYLDKKNINSASFNFKQLEDIEDDILKMNAHMVKLLELGIYKKSEISQISDSSMLDEKLKDLKDIKKKTRKQAINSTDNIISLLDFSLKSSLLKSYAENMRKKLDIFEDLEAKITIFMTHINNIFEYKKMEIDLDKGFVFKLEDGLESGRIIDPTDLSSGEQHEVILNYELIFKTENNSVILIDEPEISLHILWQKKFINNLLEIAKENSLNIIVATHSPDIVNNHRNLVYVLSEI